MRRLPPNCHRAKPAHSIHSASMKKPSLLFLVAIAALMAGCSGQAEPAATAVAPPQAVTTVGVPPSSQAPTTTAVIQAGNPTSTTPDTRHLDHYLGTFDYGPESLDVYAPIGVTDGPALVLVHGGGWIVGDVAVTAVLANELAARGVIVFNVGYRTMAKGGAFPSMVDDVACALAYARAHQGNYTTSRTTAIGGHSAGAHLSALVAMAPGVFGGDCRWDLAVAADGLIGLAGPYDITTIPAMTPLFGVSFTEDPDLWETANPLSYAKSSPDISYLLIHGTADTLVPVSYAQNLAASLEEVGLDVRLELLDGESHNGLLQPVVVNDLIVDFLEELNSR